MRRVFAIAAVASVAIALGALVGCGRPSPSPPSATAGYRGTVLVGTQSPSGWLESAADLEGAGGHRRVRFHGGSVWSNGEGPWPSGDDSSSTYTSAREAGPEVCGRATTRETLTHTPSGKVAAVRDLDAETGVELRREVYRRDGSVASRTEVTDISYGPGAASSEAPAADTDGDAGVEMTPEAFAEAADFEPSPPAYVPSGYRRSGFRGHQCDEGRWYAEYRYDDGLRALSVYERHPRGGGQGRGWRGGRGRGAGREAHGGVGRPQVIDQGIAITVRQRRGDLVVLATGDLTVDEGIAIVESVPAR